MTIGNIQEGLPSVVPRGTISVTETHTYTQFEYDDGSTVEKDVYLLDKAPIVRVDRVVALVSETETELTAGTDYAVIDDDGDGKIDSIDFGVGGDDPDPESEFTVEYVAKPIITRYIDSFEEEGSQVANDKITRAIESRQLEQASGAELNQIGRLFGELGRRRGRTDAEYRAFLGSIVQSFSGRGTIPGLKFAIAAGVNADPSDVTIIEDFAETGYEIRVDNVDTAFLSSVLNDLADLADPSGVELLSPPVIVLTGSIVDVNRTATTVTNDPGLSSGSLSDGNI